ncbi:Dyp-type peroxidase [Streptomyces odontomachi]|uniref:Dyp-type peroxidase n=1 Tax=Streptomyces odontomachi TaxID=2944940 RepID=UPI0027E27644|nr:Dyp-type peroxidase [Streptomyces sp. ODS25]
MSSRRRLLLAAIFAALGGGSAAAIATPFLCDDRRNGDKVPAFLRGVAPFPHGQILALDLAVARTMAAEAVRDAHRTVAAVDGGPVSVWLALGAGLLREPVVRPRHLKLMPSFLGDLQDPELSHGDLLVQITGTSAHQVAKNTQDLLGALPQFRVRWRVHGVRPENREEHGRGLARNPFGFTEGYGNPADYDSMAGRALVRPDQGEPTWAVGGSYQVVRIIKFADELWRQDSPREQERIIGRGRDGRWLDGTPNSERLDFAPDPHGRITPLDSHVRRAAPDRRHPPPLVRRSYNYDRGDGDRGLIFSCFQRDLAAGFEAVQKRLQGEAMAKYILTVGGGYFFVPPPGDVWLNVLFPV